MPASCARTTGMASVLGETFVLLGVGISGVLTLNYDATRDLLMRPAPSPVQS